MIGEISARSEASNAGRCRTDVRIYEEAAELRQKEETWLSN